MADTEPIRIVAIDDHPLILNALVRRLEAGGEMVVVAARGDGAGGLATVAEHGPDVVICDLSMPGSDLSGLEVITAVIAADPEARVLVLSAHTDAQSVGAAMAAGALGFVSKEADEETLCRCVVEVAAGRAAFDPSIGPKLVAALRPSPAERYGLSPKELEVLAEMADGLSNADIGARLHVSPLTVKTHVSHILAKLGVADRAAAVIKAYREDLLA
ncbi:MAG: response regulator [Acidimicrobiales bacterium]